MKLICTDDTNIVHECQSINVQFEVTQWTTWRGEKELL